MPTRFHGVCLLAVGLLFAGSPIRPLSAAPPAEIKKLHILLAFDTADEYLASSLKIDEWRMKRFLQTSIPEDRCSITLLKGKEVTSARILDYYRDLKVEPEDGLMFFYGGHGATDPVKKHYFDLSCGEQFVRADLRKAMEARHTSLVLLLTDCCSTPAKIAKTATRKSVGELEPVKEIHPTVRCLLFQARGTVDVTAATNNASWSDNQRGGLFTRAVCMMMTREVRALDVNRDNFVTWEEFFPQLQKETEIVFKSWSRELRARGEDIKSNTQKPFPFALGRQLVQESRDFAVLSIENGTDGVLQYRWRWPGMQTWNEVRLARGEKKVHYLPLTPGQQAPPALEAQIKGRPAKLPASKWTGTSDPTGDEGEHYRIRARKK